MASPTTRHLRAGLAGLCLALCALLGVATAARADSSPYPNTVFSDGFESGSFSAWDSALGTGSLTVTSGAAHSGSYGAQIANTQGQYGLIVKTLPSALVDSQTTLWAKVSSGGGLQSLAQARDSTSSQTVWALLYDPAHQALWFYPFNGSGASTEIYTGPGSAPLGTWFEVQVDYNADASGGAQLYINGQTNPAWGVSGNYSRSSNLQKLQLWNDSTSTTQFDDVSVATTPPTLPGAPTAVQGTAQDSAVALSWSPPASNGGSPITSYQITPYANGTAQTPINTANSNTNYTVSGLTDGTPYTFTVAATNSVGTGSASSRSPTVSPRPAGPPDPPTAITGTAYDGGVQLTWTPPANNGGSPVTQYRVTPYSNGAPMTPVFTNSADPEQYIGGLTDGQPYSFSVAAINVAGTGSDSALSSTVTPAAQPTSYTTSLFADGFEADNLNAWDGALGTGTVSVNAAAAHSGAYGVQLSNQPGQYELLLKSLTASAQDSAVSFWARVSSGGSLQTLAQGRDSTSQPVWSLLYDPASQGLYFYPTTGSGASTQIYTGAGSAPLNTWFKVEVDFDADAQGGAQLFLDGRSQTGWQVQGNYSRASNFQKLQLWDDSASSTEFDDVSVSTLPPPDDDSAPGPPTGVSGTARDSSVALSWQAPASDGGSPITNYRVTPYIGSAAQTAVITPSSATGYTVTGLTNGTAYTFTVAAVNALGDGPDSTPSASVTPQPASLPGVPTSVSGTPRDGAARLSWSAPASDGGGTITSYHIIPYVNGAAQTPVDTGNSNTNFTVGGLTDGTPYTFTVAATNGAGTGPASSPSAPVTPTSATAPGAPTALTGSPQNGGATLSWSAPASDGGSSITGYRITPYLNGAAQTPTVFNTSNTTETLTGLTNGDPYTFTVAAINAAGTGPESDASPAITPAQPNPIQLENEQPGDPNWGNVTAPPNPADISGYASQISVNHGQSIDFYVTTTASSVSIDVYRMGWYNGAGARLMESMGSFPGVNQPQAQPDPTTGMVAESWTKTATLSVPSSWTTGVYLARLTASNGYGSYIMFVVRDDGGHEPILFQASTNTYQAYNTYGGTSLYNNNTNGKVFSYPHALQVSFDRPFLNGNGAGQFLEWEYPFVRWLERNGYDVAYTTDTDTDSDVSRLTNHKAFLVVGHDEYWSHGMRQTVQSAIAAGVNVAFFAGNESYWQVRYAPDAAGVPDRIMIGYKDMAECDCDGGPDPMFNVNNSLLTSTFRDPLVGQPEDAMMGVMFGGETNNSPYIVTDASNWVFDGTGWANGTSVPGIVGYEYDHYFGDSSTPPGTTVLSNTPLTNTENGQPDTANSTIYTAPSGARVFAAGTIQWSWGLDNFGGTSFVNPGVQRVTSNILSAFTGGTGS